MRYCSREGVTWTTTRVRALRSGVFVSLPSPGFLRWVLLLPQSLWDRQAGVGGRLWLQYAAGLVLGHVSDHLYVWPVFVIETRPALYQPRMLLGGMALSLFMNILIGFQPTVPVIISRSSSGSLFFWASTGLLKPQAGPAMLGCRPLDSSFGAWPRHGVVGNLLYARKRSPSILPLSCSDG